MNNANNNFLIGKNSNGTAKSITGEITELSYSCRTFNYDHVDNYKIIPSLRDGKLKGTYLFDEDLNEFDNLVSPSTQGGVNRGNSYQPDSYDPPLITAASPSNYFEVSNDKYFLVKFENYEDQPTTFRVYTTIFRFRIHQLPERGSNQMLFMIRSVKKIAIRVSGSGRLVLEGSKLRSEGTTIKLNVRIWYLVKATFTLFLDQDSPHDCSLGVELEGVGEFGADFECNDALKLIFNDEFSR